MDEHRHDPRDHRLSGVPDTWPLSALDAARELGISERTIRRAIARGDLPATKHAGIYQIDPAALAHYQSRFTGSAPAHSISIALPRPPNALIGRKEERSTAFALLLREGVRVVTLTGPGGVGKTHLALSIAAEVADVFADSAYFVDLSPVREPDLVLPAIAQAIGLRDTGQRSLDESIAAFLRPRELLLVLDNVEQVIAAAPRIADLAAGCPDLHILATSRIPLRIRGEQRLPVDPLPTDDQPGVLNQSAASQLFVERARAVDPSLADTDDNLQAIAGICQRLDGLPLAIELAAAWSALLPPADLLAQLSDRMRTTGHAPRDLPDRQQTVADTIAWSYDLLAPEEQTLFRCLAVCVDGFDRDAASAIAGRPATDVTAQLGALVEQSLLRRVERPGQHTRFAMLETVREFAAEQLEGSGTADSIRNRHAGFFLTFAEQIGADVYGPEMRHHLDRFVIEYANLRAALGYLAESGDTVRELRLAAALSNYWLHRGQISEGIEALGAALARGTTAPPDIRAKALLELAALLLAVGAIDRAGQISAESVSLARVAGDHDLLGEALWVQANVVGSDNARIGEAIELLEEAVGSAVDRGIPIDRYQSGLAAIGTLWIRSGQRERGSSLLQGALEVLQASGRHLETGETLLRLGRIERQDGHFTRAAARYGDSLRAYDTAGMVTQAGYALAELAGLASTCGYRESAATIAGMVQAIAERTGIVVEGDAPYMLVQIASESATALGLGYPEAVATGRNLPFATAIAEAIAVADALAAGKPPPGKIENVALRPPVALSSRENDVLALLAQRYTAPEIADQLFLSVRTVERHVANVYNKLGVNSRRAAIATATRYGLV